MPLSTLWGTSYTVTQVFLIYNEKNWGVYFKRLSVRRYTTTTIPWNCSLEKSSQNMFLHAHFFFYCCFSHTLHLRTIMPHMVFTRQPVIFHKLMWTKYTIDCTTNRNYTPYFADIVNIFFQQKFSHSNTILNKTNCQLYNYQYFYKFINLYAQLKEKNQAILSVSMTKWTLTVFWPKVRLIKWSLCILCRMGFFCFKITINDVCVMQNIGMFLFL